jgi:hypothetical protein
MMITRFDHEIVKIVQTLLLIFKKLTMSHKFMKTKLTKVS